MPSVDSILKTERVKLWLNEYPRGVVVKAIRQALQRFRTDIEKKTTPDITNILELSYKTLKELISPNLQPVINATGVVIHTNLGRAPLCQRALKSIVALSSGYSNLEYNLNDGKRGSRHVHAARWLRELTGAEDAVVVNNNAAAVLICLSAVAKPGEVIVSRGELVEIGGSFRVPDILSFSGAILKEVGTTNKTHLYDYEQAINENTTLILKVHQSNYKIIGFTEDVKIESLVHLAHSKELPVMYDLGSGCLLNLLPNEPAVSDIVKAGVDLVTFSGDKLLGGPQAGIIAGKKIYIEKIKKHPFARAVRVDKLAIAALEATLLEYYLDPNVACETIPVLNMLLQSKETILKRATVLAQNIKPLNPEIIEETSRAGGGALPEVLLPTYALSLHPPFEKFEETLRGENPPVIVRVNKDKIILDVRTVSDEEISTLTGILLKYIKKR